MGSRHRRKLKKYSIGFEEKLNFFFRSYRKNILSFCGSEVKVDYDINGLNVKECFRLYEDGYFKNKRLCSRHPNLLRSVIIGKKGWGLWVQEWTDGIVDWTFTREEIISNFDEFDIKIPESFINDFDNVLEKKKKKRNENYLQFLRKEK